MPSPQSAQNRALLLFILAFLAGILVITVAIPSTSYLPVNEVKSQVQNAQYSTTIRTTMMLPVRVVALLAWSAIACISFLVYAFLKSKQSR